MSKMIPTRLFQISIGLLLLFALTLNAFSSSHAHAVPAQVAHTQSTQAAQAISYPADTFFNPVVPDLADPSVLFYNGYYYFTYSDSSGAITVMKSKYLSRLGDGAPAIVWTPSGNSANCCEVWAPELKLVNGVLYIYFAADDGNNNNHRMYVLQANSSDPQGSYTFMGELAAATDRWAIDGVPVQQGNTLYFVWSGWDGFTNGQQNLYIARMSNPYTISGDRVLISQPNQPWEMVDPNGLNINEAPQTLYRNGKIFITYSANGSTTDNYCLGMLTAQDNADLMNPGSWQKSGGPVFSSVDTAYGPGSNAFTTSPDGTQDWIVYNATVLSGNGSTDNWKNRSIRTQPFSWDSNGNPVFGLPASISTPVPLPSGEHRSAIRYEAELGYINHANINVETGEHTTHTAASHDEVVGQVDYSDSYVDFTVNVPITGTYVVVEGYSNGFSVTATHQISVNDQPVGSTTLPGTGAWNQYSTAVIQVPLQAGTNTIRVAHDTNWATIDYIELPIYEAEFGAITHANINVDSNASNGAYVGQIDYSDSAVQFDAYAPHAGQYTLNVHYSDGFDVNASHYTNINGVAGPNITYTPTGSWSSFNTTTVLVTLNTGQNSIVIGHQNNWATLDAIEVF